MQSLKSHWKDSLPAALIFLALSLAIIPVSLAGPEPAPLLSGGVVLTFDDRNFDDWLAALPLFEKYGAKATFFISGEIDGKTLTTARELKRHGHAIGCHSVHHYSAVNYAAEHSAEDYVRDEVLPQLEAFRAEGFEPVSFAYPMSQNNEETDAALLKVFRHLRTGKSLATGRNLRDDNPFFVPRDGIADPENGCLEAKGIDFAPEKEDRTFEQIDGALARAAKNGEVLVLYAHRIADSGKGNRLSPAALEHVLQTAKQLKLPFYTMDDLP